MIAVSGARALFHRVGFRLVVLCQRLKGGAMSGKGTHWVKPYRRGARRRYVMLRHARGQEVRKGSKSHCLTLHLDDAQLTVYTHNTDGWIENTDNLFLMHTHAGQGGFMINLRT